MADNLTQNTADESVLFLADGPRRILIGGFLGLAWGSSLRAWMTVLALHFGESPSYSWMGTFGGIVLPAGIVGALIGAAAHDAATSGTKRWRWAALSPLLLMVAPAVVTPNFFDTLIRTGLGGGAIGVALIGTLGGYAFSGFGPTWSRWLTGVLGVVFALAFGFGLFLSGSATGPREVFGGLLFVLLMGVLMAGVSTPSRYRKTPASNI